MDLGPGWVHRDALLAAARQAGYPVSNHQLLRWRNAGLLPQPRRVGRGRARGGSDSFYPWWTFLRVSELASRLKDRRSLDDAGWALWVLGFDVVDFARDLLLTDLERREEEFRDLLRRPWGVASPVLRGAARARAGGEVWRVVHERQRETTLRMIAEWQLGTLQPNRYSNEDWESFQDATIAATDPDLLDHPGLPSLPEIRAGIGDLAKHRSLPKVIQALERIDDRWFRIFTNEAQALFTMMVRSLTDLPLTIPREAFLQFFAALYVDRPTKEKIRDVRRALGWITPPLSPLEQMLARLRAAEPRGQGSTS